MAQSDLVSSHAGQGTYSAPDFFSPSSGARIPEAPKTADVLAAQPAVAKTPQETASAGTSHSPPQQTVSQQPSDEDREVCEAHGAWDKKADSDLHDRWKKELNRHLPKFSSSFRKNVDELHPCSFDHAQNRLACDLAHEMHAASAKPKVAEFSSTFHPQRTSTSLDCRTKCGGDLQASCCRTCREEQKSGSGDILCVGCNEELPVSFATPTCYAEQGRIKCDMTAHGSCAVSGSPGSSTIHREPPCRVWSCDRQVDDANFSYQTDGETVLRAACCVECLKQKSFHASQGMRTVCQGCHIEKTVPYALIIMCVLFAILVIGVIYKIIKWMCPPPPPKVQAMTVYSTDGQVWKSFDGSHGASPQERQQFLQLEASESQRPSLLTTSAQVKLVRA